MEYKKFIPRPTMNKDTICSSLYGCTIKFGKCVAWCANKKKFLTGHQVNKKGCLGKQCKCFYQVEDRAFWYMRQRKKEKRLAVKVAYSLGGSYGSHY